MTYRIAQDEARRLVRVTVEGVFASAEVAAMVSQAREASAARRWNILYDMRDASPGNMGSADMYWMPRQHPALRGADAWKVRVATLHPPALKEMAAFWEDTFRNTGLQARAFTDEPEALAGLAASAT